MAKLFIKVYVLFLSALLTGGCAAHSENNDIACDFSAAFNAEYRGLKISGSLLCTRQGNVDIGIDSPQTLSGLSFDWRGSSLKMGREDIACTADEGYIPRESFPSALRELALGIAQGRAVKSGAEGEGAVYRLSAENGEYTLTAGENGFPLTAESSEGDFKVEFVRHKRLTE